MKPTSVLAGGIAVAATLAAVSPLHAASVTGLYGGGSTLVEKTYRDLFDAYGATSNGQLCANLTTTCPTTHYNPAVELLYVGVGSGNGIKALDGHDSSLYVTGPKTPDKAPVPSGDDLGVFYGTGKGINWAPTTTGTGPFYPKVTFSGSDNILAATDVSAVAALGFGPIIQVPGVVAAIAVPFKPSAAWKPEGAQPTGGSSKVQLSTNTLCGIFTGAIQYWNNAEITKDNKNVPLGKGKITVVYRNDSSGTTFLFTNALLNQCGTQSHPVAKSTHPFKDQWVQDAGLTYSKTYPYWTSSTTFYISVFNAKHLPANFLNDSTLTGVTGGASGSGGVQKAINAINGSIGYVSPDFVLPVDPNGPAAANLQTWISHFNGTAPVYRAPTAANATLAMGGVTPPTFTGAKPAAANPLKWGAVAPRPTNADAYAISGFSFIDLYSCYSSATDVAALVGTTAKKYGYLTWYYGASSVNANVPKDILSADGFAPVPPAWATAINKLLTSPTLGIGSPKTATKAGTKACKTVTKGA